MRRARRALVDAPPAADAAREPWLARLALQQRIHDDAVQRLSALVLQLGLLRQLPDGADADALIDAAQDTVHAVLEELRVVSQAIYPPLLAQAGLGAALREVARRCPVPVRVVGGDQRSDPALEGAACFAISGALCALGPKDAPVVVTLTTLADAVVAVVEGLPAAHLPAVVASAQVHLTGLGGSVVGATGGGGTTVTVAVPAR